MEELTSVETKQTKKQPTYPDCPWISSEELQGNGLPTPIFLPGESHGQRSLVGYGPWGRKESDMTEWLTLSISFLVWTPPVQFSSVTQSCPTLCNPMTRSTPGLPVHHQLPEFTQIHIHRVSDAIQPSHPLSSPSPPAHNPSQHQSLFQ